jgi:hypothetical protein
MLAVSSPPTPRTFRPPFSREEEADSFGQITPSQAAQALAGGGLMVWGLLRGTWSGLALTAVGGVLVYRSLGKRGNGTLPPEEFPLENDLSPGEAEEPTDHLGPWYQAGSRGDEPTAEERAVASEEVQPVGAKSPARSNSWPAEEMTPEEHAKARVRAYLHALQRGGNSLPPYDPAAAAGDFCRAAGEVLAQRVGG